jgi:uncharacterized membrane protein
VAALAPTGVAVKVVVLLPMVLLVPGYALAAALFPPGSISAGLRAVYGLALSFAACALAGVVAQLVVGLDRTSWAVLLFVVTVAACAAALRRRENPPGEPLRPLFDVPGVNPLAAVAVLAAIAIASWAFSIASNGAHEQHDEARFAALWALPQQGAAGAGRVTIGVSNHEGRPTEFQVRVTQRGRLLSGWRVPLGDGRRWQASLPAAAISEAAPLLVTLLKDGQVYRRTYLRRGPAP